MDDLSVAIMGVQNTLLTVCEDVLFGEAFKSMKKLCYLEVTIKALMDHHPDNDVLPCLLKSLKKMDQLELWVAICKRIVTGEAARICEGCNEIVFARFPDEVNTMQCEKCWSVTTERDLLRIYKYTIPDIEKLVGLIREPLLMRS
tara:strand:+ start:191 stop:625 length:435 start_codon:yes stop_codon:yes gene_type:complete